MHVTVSTDYEATLVNLISSLGIVERGHDFGGLAWCGVRLRGFALRPRGMARHRMAWQGMKYRNMAWRVAVASFMSLPL